MAKNPDKDGKMRDQLKSALDPRKVVETVVNATSEEPANAPPKTVHETIEAAIDKGDPVVSTSGETVAVISKPEAEMLARRFQNKSKEATLPLDKTVAEVQKRNAELQKLKADKIRTKSTLVAQLRATDPTGKRTCSFCGQRVLLTEMCSKKELCEVCAS